MNVKIRNRRLAKRVFEHVLFKIHSTSLDIRITWERMLKEDQKSHRKYVIRNQCTCKFVFTLLQENCLATKSMPWTCILVRSETSVHMSAYLTSGKVNEFRRLLFFDEGSRFLRKVGTYLISTWRFTQEGPWTLQWEYKIPCE